VVVMIVSATEIGREGGDAVEGLLGIEFVGEG